MGAGGTRIREGRAVTLARKPPPSLPGPSLQGSALLSGLGSFMNFRRGRSAGADSAERGHPDTVF